MEEEFKLIPLPTIRRLPQYLRFLRQLRGRKRDVVSCTHIAEEFGIQSIQVRKDLALAGAAGKPKVGYEVGTLIDQIESFLGWDNVQDAFVVGAGNLGSALLGYSGFKELGCNVLAAFDIDPQKIGTRIQDKEVFDLEKLGNLADRLHVKIAILTVPASAAQETAQKIVAAGIRAVWNYTPVQLDLPKTIIVEDVRLAASWAVLSSRLSAGLKLERKDAAEAGND